MSRFAIIVDIDGTLADNTHRLHHIQKSPKDWYSFFEHMCGDSCHDDMAALVNNLNLAYDIILCSGRPENWRRETIIWLNRHYIKFNALFMRPAGDRRDDAIVKRELLDQIGAWGYRPVMAIDDRQRVVDMWRQAGLRCLQCARGDF